MNIVMKISKKVACLLAISLFGTFQLSAQEAAPKTNDKDINVQRHTVMDKFGAEMIRSAEERRQMKIAHLVEIEKLKKALDTMDISRRKKRLILDDLINKPYSDRVNQALAEISFEDDDGIDKE